MLKAYSFELLISLTVAFMIFYPPIIGAALFLAALAMIAGLKVLEHKEAPDVTKLKDEVKELKTKVEQLVLRGNR